jgi:VanZ family protein
LKKFKPSFIPAILWLIISTTLLILPGSSLPKEDWLDKIWLDKWVHIILFAIMVFLWCWAVLRKYPANKRLKIIFFQLAVISLAYGIGMEFIQKYFIPNRSFSTGDILADTAGCIIGLIYSMGRYIKK